MLSRHELMLVLTGSLSTLVGVGLSRFAYTPLLPELIEAGWFSANHAIYLGAANLLGYFVGALGAHRLAHALGTQQLMRIAFSVIACSFLFCVQPASFTWFFLCRFSAGVAGAVLMVVGPSLALMHTPSAQRSRLGPLFFTGIGLGALLSATLIPLLLGQGLAWTWASLGLLSLASGLVVELCQRRLPTQTTSTQHHAPPPTTIPTALILLIILAYAMDAAGFIPHTLFWADFLAREAQLGTHNAAQQWAIFGLGAMCGPFLAAIIAKHLSCQHTLLGAYVLKTAAIALPLISLSWLSQSASSFIVGALTPGIASLVATRIAELVNAQQQRQIWGWATAAFALTQALSGYAMSASYTQLGSYLPLFASGSALLGLGALLLCVSRYFMSKRA